MYFTISDIYPSAHLHLSFSEALFSVERKKDRGRDVRSRWRTLGFVLSFSKAKRGFYRV